MPNLFELDAVETAKLVRERKITSVELTNRYIAHLHSLNPIVNCLSQDRFEAAQREAADADARLNDGLSLGRLHGVPISIKDCFHVKGMATTAGLPYRSGLIEQKDAEIVTLLKQEGAIILGKTNTPALCFCQETDNKLHGRTNNPWDVTRTAGGSSGGEAALIAVGGAAVGVGADIGGSIRFPSHFNGVIGFKSGNRQISAVGNYPDVTIEEQERMLGIGAMAKSVRDARLLNEVMAKNISNAININEFQLVIPERLSGIPLSEETENTLLSLRETLQTSFPITTEMPPLFEQAALLWQLIMSIDGAGHIRALMSEGGRSNALAQFFKEKMFGNTEIHPYLSWAVIGASLFKPSAQKVSEIREILKRGDEQISDYFADKVVVLPVYHRAAPPHGRVYKDIFSVRKTYLKYMPYVAYANVWGLPALTIPVSEDADGMPIAVQLISRVGNEGALFDLGEQLERLFRGYRRCKKVDR